MGYSAVLLLLLHSSPHSLASWALGHHDDEVAPVVVEALAGRPVTLLACGWRHTVALCASGEVRPGWPGLALQGEGDGGGGGGDCIMSAGGGDGSMSLPWPICERHTEVELCKGNVQWFLSVFISVGAAAVGLTSLAGVQLGAGGQRPAGPRPGGGRGITTAPHQLGQNHGQQGGTAGHCPPLRAGYVAPSDRYGVVPDGDDCLAVPEMHQEPAAGVAVPDRGHPQQQAGALDAVGAAGTNGTADAMSEAPALKRARVAAPSSASTDDAAVPGS